MTGLRTRSAENTKICPGHGKLSYMAGEFILLSQFPNHCNVVTFFSNYSGGTYRKRKMKKRWKKEEKGGRDVFL